MKHVAKFKQNPQKYKLPQNHDFYTWKWRNRKNHVVHIYDKEEEEKKEKSKKKKRRVNMRRSCV
jgi:hypothetical protein